MRKEEENKKNKKKKKEEISTEWFESHEEATEDKKEPNEEEFLEEFFDKDENFNSRLREFLANQRKDVSLEKMIEIPSSNLESLPERKDEEDEKPEKIEYLLKNEDEGVKYDPAGRDTTLKRPELTNEDVIIEEQKKLYKHLKLSNKEMVGERNPGMKYVRPDETTEKDYMTRKKFGDMSDSEESY